MFSRSASRNTAFSLAILAPLTLSLFVTAPVHAQVAGATLQGTVTDASGAVIPRAQVIVRNVETGINTTVPTNSDGFYTVPNLLPGSYEMTVSAPGFSTEVDGGIT